jgi:hypothetical protein
MAEAGMTKLYWYEIELDKLIKQGYASGEAHKIVIDWLSKMEGVIEWWDKDNNNLTVLLDNEEV